MMVRKRHCFGCLLLTLSMLWALSGCRSNAPKFPPTEETVRNAVEELGWTLDLDQSMTHSISEDQIIYNLVTEEQMNISVGCTEVEGERILTVSSIAFMLPDKPEFSWTNGEKVVTLAETLYGLDQGALYQALSEQDMPERSIPAVGPDTPTGQASLSWVAELPAGYARVRWIIAAGATEHTFPEPIIKNWRETFIISLYESKEAYVTSAVIPQDSSPESMADLPKLEVAGSAEGMGFEGYMAYDINELAVDTGWDGKTDFETLPVYKNVNPADAAGAATGDRDTLEAIVRDVAGRLGVTELTITDDSAPTKEEQEKIGQEITDAAPATTYVMGTGNGVVVTAYAHQQVQVEFSSPTPLPDGLHFSDDASYEQMKAAGEYLAGTYAALWDMEEPVVDVRGGDRNIYGEQSYQLHIYEGGGDTAERLFAHNLKSAWLCPQDGGLWIVWLDNYDLSEKVGDYLIITSEEAKALLCKGNYITTVPEEMPGENYIARVELVYRGERTAKYFTPYYRFLVELPSMVYTPVAHAEDGTSSQSTSLADMNTYGAYYVPAVQKEYLTEMPVWDGSFNG